MGLMKISEIERKEYRKGGILPGGDSEEQESQAGEADGGQWEWL